MNLPPFPPLKAWQCNTSHAHRHKHHCVSVADSYLVGGAGAIQTPPSPSFQPTTPRNFVGGTVSNGAGTHLHHHKAHSLFVAPMLSFRQVLLARKDREYLLAFFHRRDIPRKHGKFSQIRRGNLRDAQHAGG
uniref:Uncharacterized protein n=1 Tax=Trieres chinensis TaxID=1514140 RepID=A0A7S1Z900_TRICV|mmetsp:Transcript_19953/g.40413  ORF Transcript_19953/g.40413 Transcript_19953/m.40413 type:complete len:132 (+) Transcript_19953:59-454(+)